ncbi:uncharacterized protein LOC119765054 [Culex quinquefasciatus]|uniref:uncharacterized protein LOC119765054 n=1 Tax=Culex quinquefasciatus TaxID=7176 RepID=UPI0018E34858|nr:uncharacterized protein LOC119765054 [Culex quinquefasciatus]
MSSAGVSSSTLMPIKEKTVQESPVHMVGPLTGYKATLVRVDFVQRISLMFVKILAAIFATCAVLCMVLMLPQERPTEPMDVDLQHGPLTDYKTSLVGALFLQQVALICVLQLWAIAVLQKPKDLSEPMEVDLEVDIELDLEHPEVMDTS